MQNTASARINNPQFPDLSINVRTPVSAQFEFDCRARECRQIRVHKVGVEMEISLHCLQTCDMLRGASDLEGDLMSSTDLIGGREWTKMIDVISVDRRVNSVPSKMIAAAGTR